MIVVSMVSSYILVVALSLFSSGAEALVNANATMFHWDSSAIGSFVGSFQIKYLLFTRHRCTTSLVGARHVMTTARCLIYQVRKLHIVEPLNLTLFHGEVVMGHYHFRNLSTMKRVAQRVDIHPKYRKIYGFESGVFDVGVIKLWAAFDSTTDYLPTLEPSFDDDIESQINSGSLKCYLYSFGSDELYLHAANYCVGACMASAEAKGGLRKQNIAITPKNNEKCCQVLTNQGEKDYCKKNIKVENGLRCANSAQSTSTTAPGDEGGLLMCLQNGLLFVNGLYSGKVIAGEPNPNPEVFTEINVIRDAIYNLVPTSKAIFIRANYLAAAIYAATMITY